MLQLNIHSIKGVSDHPSGVRTGLSKQNKHFVLNVTPSFSIPKKPRKLVSISVITPKGHPGGEGFRRPFIKLR